jgi:apolipoprotein N-acyltransferase
LKAKSILLSITSGVLLALSFPFPSVGFFAWVGIIPLLFALKHGSGKAAFFNGVIFGFTFFLITIYWIQVFGYVAWFLLALVLSLWTGIFAVGTHWFILNFSSPGQVFMIPLLWSIVEYGRSVGRWGFGWANLGSTVANNHVASIASFAGEIGLSYVIVLVNVLFFILAGGLCSEIIVKKSARSNANFSRNTPKNIPRISIAVISILVLLSVSVFASFSEDKSVSASSEIPYNKAFNKTRDGILDADTRSKTISVSMIQPNIPQYVKLNSANNDAIKKIYKEMTLKALAQSKEDPPDVIIWPESVIVEYANCDQEFYKGITDTIVGSGASFLYGTLSHGGTDTIFNNAVFTDINKKTLVYHKIHLVPFGEYVPARNLVESINDMAGLVADKTAGSSYNVFDFQSKHAINFEQGRNLSNSKQNIRNGQYTEGKFSSIICFESADSVLVGKMVRNGARLIIVLTNDGWFGDTAALEQHFRIGRIRAIEYGVPLIQASNTGVSGVIDSDGTVLNKALSNKRIILRGKVGFALKPSFYASIEPWMPVVLILLFISGIAAFTGNHRRNRRANKTHAFLE